MRLASLCVGQRCLALASFAALVALPLQGSAQESDLPGRVGRVADFAGQLFLSPQDRPADREAIGINYPITSGGNLWVSGDGRAEIDYGGGQFRLAGDSSVHLSRLDDRQLALFVAQGQVIVRVRSQDPGDATHIDTPNTQVALTRPGLYRIDVAPDRQATTLTVREGAAEVALANDVQRALPGQTVLVSGTNAAGADVRPAQAADGFDVWSADRDRLYDRAHSATYVSREMVGYADLDRYGSWQSYPDYGAVWFPTAVAPDWAPYRDGYWTDLGAWGPTWVDYAPWGYAPFHYGRWAYIGGRWGWCPGAYTRRPVWAPALVAWYGGSQWGVAVGRGGPVYGWVPLGWREAYHPTWRQCSYNCWARYNRPYAVNVTVRPSAPPGRYANLAVPGALSAVADTNWSRRRPVAPNLVSVPASLATSAPVLPGAPPMASRTRPMPNAPPNGDVPAAASTHTRAYPSEPASPRATFRQGTPAGSVEPVSPRATFRPATPTDSGAPMRRAPPQLVPPKDVAPPAVAPPRIGTPGDVAPASSEAPRQVRRDMRAREATAVPPTRQPAAGSGTSALPPGTTVAPPNRMAPPVRPLPSVTPTLPGAAGVARPATVPQLAPTYPAAAGAARSPMPQVAPAPALVVPAPNPQSQASPAAPANARGGRPGGDKPDMTPGGASGVK